MTSADPLLPKDDLPDDVIGALAREVAVDLKRKRVLDCSCGSVKRSPWLAEANAAGVDALDPTSDTDWAKLFGLKEERYQLLMSSGTLHLFDHSRLEKLLARLHDLLKPGGTGILHTRPVFAADAAGLAESLRVPIPHVLFDKKTIETYLARKGAPKPPALLPYCAATWLMIYRCAGFDIRKVVRHPSQVPADVFDRFSDRLSWFDKSELHTGDLTVVLQRPLTGPDLLPLAISGAKG